VEANVSPTRRGGWWLCLFAVLVLTFLMLPSLIVVIISFAADPYMSFPPRGFTFDWYRQFLSSPEWLSALSVSLRAATLTSIIATTVGTLASFGLRRVGGRFGASLRAALLAPAIVPVVLIAAATFMLFARLHLQSRFAGIVIAHSTLALPFVFITVSAALETYDFALDRAARSLGAGPLRCFFTVTLPQLRAPLGAAALFAFLTSFDEAVIALFITSGSSATLAQRMFESLRDDLDPVIAAISTLMIAVTSAVFVIAQILLRRSGGSRQ
jgi:putative spermidine/putrescine transport system permease protein